MPEDVINGVTPLERELAGVHPRLFFTEASLAALKAKLDREPWRSLFAPVRKLADEERLPFAALTFRLTGEAKYLETSRRAVLRLVNDTAWPDNPALGGETPRDALHDLALAYDWLYAELGDDLRQQACECLAVNGRKHYEPMAKHEMYVSGCYAWNIAMHYFSNVAVAGLAIYGDAPDLAPWLRYILEHCRVITASLGADGVSAEGICYGGFFTDYYVRTMALAKDLLGVDFFAANDYLKNVPAFYQYSMTPTDHLAPGSVHMCFGDGVRYNWHGPDYFLRRLAAEYADPHAQWVAQTQFDAGASTQGGAFLNLAWADPEVPAAPPTDLPTLRHFDDKDLVVMRSDWDGNEAVFGFRCGPHAGHHALQNYPQCIGGGHMTCDAGSFLLFAHGDWLISDGWYAYKHTEYRNTVLVDGIGQTGETNDALPWFECSELRREKRGPSVVHVESNAGYDYVVGNAMPAYEHAAGLTRYLRHVLYVKPYCWVIIDELQTREPATFDLFFHAFGQNFQTDRPFIPSGANAWITGGEHGSLRITALQPANVQGFPEEQPIKGIGAHHDRDMNILRLRNTEPAAATIFVTVLEAFPTNTAPEITPSIDGDMLTLSYATGREERFALEFGQRDLAAPAIFPAATE